MPFLYLADSAVPDSLIQVVVWPILLSVAAFFIFYGGWWVENRLTPAPWKWAALVPVGIALLIGWNTFHWYRLYNFLVPGSKMMYAHYLAIAVPVIGLIAIIVFHRYNHRLNLFDDE